MIYGRLTLNVQSITSSELEAIDSMDERLLAADDSRWVGTKCIIDHTVGRRWLHRDFGEPHARPRSDDTGRDRATLQVNNLRISIDKRRAVPQAENIAAPDNHSSAAVWRREGHGVLYVGNIGEDDRFLRALRGCERRKTVVLDKREHQAMQRIDP
jgi:hypothetical protein